MSLQIVARCPSCDAALPLDAVEPEVLVRCGRCGREVPLDITPALLGDHAVDRCPLCAGPDFYIRKDFDPKVGLTIIIIGAVISSVFYWFGRDLIAYGLAAATLVDLVIYGRLKDLTVCYRCHTEFRGAYQRSAPAFDLHTADVLELEYERRIRRR